MINVRIALAGLIHAALVVGCTHNGPTPNPPQAAEGTGVPEGVIDVNYFFRSATTRIADRRQVCSSFRDRSSFLL